MRKIKFRAINGAIEIIKGQLSTGFKDKNGKEIYEGDKLIWDNYGNKKKSGIVYYNTCSGSWGIKLYSSDKMEFMIELYEKMLNTVEIKEKKGYKKHDNK